MKSCLVLFSFIFKSVLSSTIDISVSSRPFNYLCSNNILNIFGLTMNVLTSVNGSSFIMPMWIK